MFDIAFKNIIRQKTRSFLTILGIIIGIGAIVALGSIAEGINAAIESGLQLTSGKITVIEKHSGLFGFMGSLDEEDLETIKSIGGVKDVVPVLVYLENIMPLQGPEWVAIGIDTTKGKYFIGENVGMDEGRGIYEDESEVAVVGKDMAEKYNLNIHDYFTIKGKDFEIVGILEKTEIRDIDLSIIVPIKDLQNLLDIDTFQMVYIIPEDVRDTERIAEEIEDADEKLDALTSKEYARQASQIVDRIRFFTFGMGAIAAFVGGLGIMNTMIMAVMERRREIGVMKAIGATDAFVLKQFLLESALISFIGGVGGIFLGVISSFLLNIFSHSKITTTVTPQLALTGLGFALFLGIIGGYYPSRKAAKLDPVIALRYE